MRYAAKPRGRALTLEELERMLDAATVVRPRDAEGWQLLLKGLFYGGFRLGEALALSWDAHAPVAVVGIDGACPFIRIDAASQKGARETITPAVSERVDLLRPLPSRSGDVFAAGLRTRGVAKASVVIAAIARKANVPGTAHDLRRSFAVRWAKRLPAQQLRLLMRHASIEATLAFYATDDCGLGEAVWGKIGDISGDKPATVRTAKGEKRQKPRGKLLPTGHGKVFPEHYSTLRPPLPFRRQNILRPHSATRGRKLLRNLP